MYLYYSLSCSTITTTRVCLCDAGYHTAPGAMIAGLPANPYFAMQMSPAANMKPFAQQMISAQPLYQSIDASRGAKPLTIAPKPGDLTVGQQALMSSPKSKQVSKTVPTSSLAIDLTKESIEPPPPVTRATVKPSVIVTSNIQLSTQLIARTTTTPLSVTTSVSPSKAGKPTKDILDLDSRKVKVHTGAVGEMERHSPLKVPKSAKSTVSGVATKKPKLDANQRAATKAVKSDKAATARGSAGKAAAIMHPLPSAAAGAQAAVVTPPPQQATFVQTAVPAGVMPVPLVNIPRVNSALVPVPAAFQARHILPGQVTLASATCTRIA